MEIIIKGSTKEIADLMVQIQGQLIKNEISIVPSVSENFNLYKVVRKATRDTTQEILK